jgi:hypothetical protein
VIYAGHSVKPDEADTVDKGAYNLCRALSQERLDNTKNQCQNAKTASDDVGDHVHDLFPAGVVGELPLMKRNSFAHKNNHLSFSLSLTFYLCRRNRNLVFHALPPGEWRNSTGEREKY